MSRVCISCNEEMVLADMSTGSGYTRLEKRGAGIFNGVVSEVSAYVCAKCGRIELVADSPEIFKTEIS